MLEDQFQLPAVSAEEALSRVHDGAVLIDLRKPPAVLSSGKRISGAELRNPFLFSHGDPLNQADGPLITFCVHGHEVSQFACALLMLHGRDVHYVIGGFEALVASGAELEDVSE